MRFRHKKTHVPRSVGEWACGIRQDAGRDEINAFALDGAVRQPPLLPGKTSAHPSPNLLGSV